MDYPEGFFPERRILAMRRQALLVPAAPAQPDSRRNVPWVAFAVFFPTWITIGAVGAFRHPAALLVVCYLLAGLALTGIFVGGYRALRGRYLATP